MVEKHTGKILVIDDQAINREICQANLEMEGFEVLAAGGGMEGVSMAKKNLPDLVLLDIMMPDLDGYQVLEKMKGSKDLKHIPILMLTARTGTNDIIRALELGASDYVKKPFDVNELVARCKTLVSLKQSEDRLRNDRNFIDNLLKGMAHDLNNIFYALRLFEVVEKRIQKVHSELDPQMKLQFSTDFELIEKTMNYLKVNIATGEDLTRGGLALSEASQSVKTLQPLSGILQSAINILKKNLVKTKINMDLQIQENIQPVYCNESDIYRVIMNIIINAIFAMNKTEVPELKVRLWQGEKEAKISISDNGTGIPDDVLPKIFDEKFSTREKGKGNGLGLALVKRIMENHNGEIKVSTVQGEGTSFTLIFPAGG